ncbi:insulin-like receptor isoform X2 [Harmonia axyridis]|uniref:insulin-like receptor isoform X2 n=1 Tax=Harmonia axyridis TaxID=115357 RepID=UPI001E276A67|nr:insulin-like receptor isoform X2 [Harmonia axyridis]XP_045482515.1 insulin-like receptor isoform X2 [Harmonia axyridis]XP_045482516.1 insulin-like receptor isoform X2 [Harmonia axyridis]
MAAEGISQSTSQPPWRSVFVTGPITLFVLLIICDVSAQNALSEYQDGICKSVDIRNSLETFERLRGCRVVEGFVQILLFDNVNKTLLSNISFPELMEITDYLLLYRVNGLRSVGQLFPNLTVIRGQNSFYKYSLIVFEMSSLQEIALHSLSNITNGYIRIDKNPSLCFIKSIDWEKIVSGNEQDINYINPMKPENECPICPGEETSKEVIGTQSCPIAPYKSKTIEVNRKRHLCWNRSHCQKICPKNCTACNNRGECCNKDCLGGCADDDVNNCKVCSNFEVWEGGVRKCVDKCPHNTLEFLGRRCITPSECKNMPRPINLPGSEPLHPYNIHLNKKCVLKCPVNMNVDQQICVPCEKGKCKKPCQGMNIDSVETAKQLTGCTQITGSLEIQIRGGSNVVNELEESLSMIEEIDGYLKIVRSFPLVSLNFLKSLKRIRGNSLDSQKSVFVVLDNQNLQDLWDWKDNRTLTIDKGRLFFHFNPKLCLDKIRTLQSKTGLYPPFTELEVANSSNGDKIACDVKQLNVSLKQIGSRAVSISWQPFKLDDQRNLLGYIVYSIQTKYRNLTLYDGRDACGGDGWRVDDVTIQEDHEQEVVHLLTHLKPYTQYAFYVKTYTIAKENNGAQSNITYFTTSPSEPSTPPKLTVTSDSSDSLKITWAPPLNPNGNITHYIVWGKKQTSNIDFYRNFCEDSNFITIVAAPTHQTTSSEPPPNVDNSSNITNGTCSCDDKGMKESSINEEIQTDRIEFENALHNEVYIRKPIETRKRRAAEFVNSTIRGGDLFHKEVPSPQTELVINNLHHFTSYEISVQACRKKEEGKEEDRNPELCSQTKQENNVKTLVKDGADDIKRIYVINQTMESVTIRWDDLEDPNGMIFKYFIEYKRNTENAKPSVNCITHDDWKKQGRIYTLKLSPGNYSLRVRAITAGSFGKYSPYAFFVIKEPSKFTVLIMSIVLPLFVMGLLTIFLCYKKQKMQKNGPGILVPTINPEYMPTVYVPDEWEIPRKNVELKTELGQGSFGMVYEGKVFDIRGIAEMKCAVKTVNDNSTDRERLEFLNEASVMKGFDTAHVVKLLGVVSQGQPTFVVMELMANGDLKSYLRSQRPDSDSFTPNGRHSPTLKQILQMAIEIADGMAYLSAKKFVHRDLAARNCMVSENLVVKIGDFGMTRDIYETDYYRKGTKGLLPVRWMAPESLKDGVFTSSSDVWSYGVVLWEMATLASQPYQGLSNDQVLRYVIDGGVMERPENCPDKLYTLMRFCWQHKASARPSFLKLCSLLLEDASPGFAEVSFYHSSAGLEARTSRPTPSPSQDDPSTPLRPKEDTADNLSLTNSNQDSDIELDIESGTHINFPSINNYDCKDSVTTTANGYLSGCPTNGVATTQC